MSACAGRGRVNPNCTWAPQSSARLHDDAELAEDLAIRYADVHRGRRSGRYEGAAQYASARDECMAALFAHVARDHGVTIDDVRAALLRRPPLVDAAVIGSFLILLATTAIAFSAWVFLAFDMTSGIAAAIAAAVASLPAGVAAWLLGGLWSAIIEMIRLGNEHMSYRAERTPWSRHPFAFLLVCIVVFWCACTARFATMPIRRHRGEHAT